MPWHFLVAVLVKRVKEPDNLVDGAVRLHHLDVMGFALAAVLFVLERRRHADIEVLGASDLALEGLLLVQF